MTRTATADDFGEIINIAREAFRDQPEQLTARKLQNAVKFGHILTVSIGIRKPRLNGFVLCENDRPYKFITWIAVRRGHRGNGVGKQLMDSVVGPAFAWVWHTNKTSAAFFQGNGFRLKGKCKDGWQLFQRD